MSVTPEQSNEIARLRTQVQNLQDAVERLARATGVVPVPTATPPGLPPFLIATIRLPEQR